MAKLTLRLKTFIPQSKIKFGQVETTAVYYEGDGRSSDWYGTYRTMQEFTIDTSTSNYTVQHNRQTGITKALHYHEPTGQLVHTETGQASTSGLTYTKRVENDILYLDCVCSIGNPLEPASPNIDYKFTIKVTRPGSVRITGLHDGFPAYELWRKLSTKTYYERVYFYDPVAAGAGVSSLFPPMDKSVDQGLSA